MGQGFLRRFRRRSAAFWLSIVILAVFASFAVFADIIAALYGHHVNDTFPNLLDQYGIPLGVNGGISARHWFGLEPGVGRDLFLQIVYGARTSLGIGIIGAALTTALGVAVGLFTGYVGGALDSAVAFATNVVLAFPFVFFAFGAIPVFNSLITGSPYLSGGLWAQILTIVGIMVMFGWPGTARLVRGETLVIRELAYVDAARVLGAGPGWILLREVLPNLLPQVLVNFTLAIPGFITAETGLSFLGIGIGEPVPDWGRLVLQSIPYVQADWTFAVFPGTSIFLVVVAFNVLAGEIQQSMFRIEPVA